MRIEHMKASAVPTLKKARFICMGTDYQNVGCFPALRQETRFRYHLEGWYEFSSGEWMPICLNLNLEQHPVIKSEDDLSLLLSDHAIKRSLGVWCRNTGHELPSVQEVAAQMHPRLPE